MTLPCKLPELGGEHETCLKWTGLHVCILNHGTKLRRSVVTEGGEGFMVISPCGSGCLGPEPGDRIVLASGKFPHAWSASWLVASTAWVCPGSPGWGTVSVSGGGFLTSGWEGSARNHKIWGWRLISQLWEPEVFTQKRLFSLSCAI